LTLTSDNDYLPGALNMDKKLRNKWIKALTSGEYKQGRSHLKVVDGKGNAKYCCLGVLCEVAGIKEDKDSEEHLKFFDQESGTLSDYLLKKFRMTEDQADCLISMNDGNNSEVNPRSRNMKFKTIAKWIKENL
jgi:hypothetical protein